MNTHCLACGRHCDGDVCDTSCAIRLDREREQHRQFLEHQKTGLRLCENHDTDPEVSGCDTPYDRVTVYPNTRVHLCASCRAMREEREQVTA